MMERFKKYFAAKDSIEDSRLQSVAEGITDPRGPVTVGLSIIAVAFIALMVWILFAPLDEGVPAAGTVTVESKRKIVQHLSGGIIKKILVKEAQEVRAGHPLIILDDTMVKANFDATRQEYYTLRAQTDRLHAEVARSGTISFDPALLEAKDDPVAAESMSRQKNLFLTRRAALQGELGILAVSEREVQDQIHALQAQLVGKQEQLGFTLEQLEGSRQLAGEGYLPRKSLFEEERLAADLQANVNELKSSIMRVQNSAIVAKQRLAQRQRDFQKEVETDFFDTQRKALTAEERFRSAREDFQRTVIRAPVDGNVNGLTALTEGSVIPPGGRVMDIIPQGEALVLEVKIDPGMIDRVHKGLPVIVSMQAFADDPSLVLDGVLITVSPDVVSDSNSNNPPYFQGRVEVTPEGMRKLGARQLQPGMPGQVTIRTGERTVLQYLLKPLLMRLASAMKEV